MPYTITLTNGALLTTVADDSVDTTTSIGLVGRSYLGYGQIIANDLVHMLENFSNSSPPKSPLVGQFWYDNSQGFLNLWNGLAWQHVTGSGGGDGGGNGSGSSSDLTLIGNLSNSNLPIPSDTAWSQIFTRELVIDQTTNGGHIAFNSYLASGPTWRYRADGPAGLIWLDNTGSLQFLTMPSGTAGSAWSGTPAAQLQLASTGNLTLIDGDFVISRSNSGANLWLQKSGNTANQIIGCTGSSPRWAIYPGDSTPETGSNSGSDFFIYRYSDAGTSIDAPFWIQRSSGIINHSTRLVQGGQGISYTIAPEGPVHRIGFGWSGSAGILMVDGTNQGPLATQAYVAGSLTGYLPLTGGTISGSLVVKGNVSAQNMLAYNAIYPSTVANSQFYIASNSTDVIINFQNGWCLAWGRTDGRLRFISGSRELFVCDGSGDGAFYGNLLADQGVFIAGNSGYKLWMDTSSNRHIQFTNDLWKLTWRGADGLLYFSRFDGAVLWSCDASGNTVIPGRSYALSHELNCDMRLKTDIEPFNAGLTELLKLKPSSWRFNGSGGVNDDGRRHVGLHAQDLEAVIPESVHVIPEKQITTDEKVTDQLAVDTTPILAAVINALHEISDRLAVLEAKINE